MTLEEQLAAQSKRILDPLDALIAQVNQLLQETAEPPLSGRRAIRDADHG